MTLLILAPAVDRTAVRVAALAAERGTVPVRMVSPIELAQARWIHRVDSNDVDTIIRLRDGTTLRSTDFTGVFNRMWGVPEVAFFSFAAADREYAVAEMHALVASWLASLRCAVINRGSPHALCGSAFSASRWQTAAARVGLPVLAGGSDSLLDARMPAAVDRLASVVVLCRATWSAGLADDEHAILRDGCRRLAASAGVELLRIHFINRTDGRGWRFWVADPMPDLEESAPLSTLLDVLTGKTTKLGLAEIAS